MTIFIHDVTRKDFDKIKVTEEHPKASKGSPEYWTKSFTLGDCDISIFTNEPSAKKRNAKGAKK